MLVPVLYYAILAVLATLPLAFVAGHTVLGWGGDSHYFVWLIDWVYQCFFHLHRSPFWVPYLNYPDGVSLFCNEWTPASVAMALPFHFLGGATFAYNAVVLLTFFLSGLAMHIWVRRLTGCTAAAYVAGTLFAISPYRSIRALGHLNLLATQWLPLYFMCLTAMLNACERRREETGAATSPYTSAAMAGLLLALLALSTAYYLYMTLVVSVFFVGFYFLFVQRSLARTARFWKAMALLIGIVVVPAFVSVAPYIGLRLAGLAEARPPADADRYGASPEHLIVPSWQHFLWGRAIERAVYRTRPIDHVQYLGLVALGLGAVGVLRGRRIGRREEPWEEASSCHHAGRLVPVLACTAGVALILALGNHLHVGEKEVRLPVPEAFRQVAGGDSVPVLLPGYILFKWLPFYDMMRVWMRYGLYAGLFLSVLAGIGAAYLLSGVEEGTRRAVALLLIALVLLDFMPAHRFIVTIRPRGVDQWLATNGEPGAWMQYPFRESYRGEVNYNAAASGRPYVGGYFSFSPPQFRRNAAVLARFPRKDSIDRLLSIGCRYVVVHSLRVRDWEKATAALESAGCVRRFSSGMQHVYELPGRAAEVP